MLKRIYKKELIDDFSIVDDKIISALNELRVINKYLGGISTTKNGIKKLFAGDKKLKTVLDAGAGSSDILYGLKEKYNLKIFSADINPGICRHLAKNSGEKLVINADLYSPPVKHEKFDFVHASLFFHHFSEEEIVCLLKSFLFISKKGIIINDLHRSVFAFISIKVLTRLFSKSLMVKNDAPLSVRRGFKKKELIELMKTAGVNHYKIYWNWAFRWLIIIYK